MSQLEQHPPNGDGRCGRRFLIFGESGLGADGAVMRIERVTDAGVLEAIYRLRVAAWRSREPDFPKIEAWSDGFDGEALHWAAFDGRMPVAAARLTVHDTLEEAPDAGIFVNAFPHGLPEPFGMMSRLCVVPSHAGRGVSRKLDEIRVEFARRLGCSAVVGYTMTGLPRAASMQAFGFEEIISGVDYRAGVLSKIDDMPKSVMLKPLWRDFKPRAAG